MTTPLDKVGLTAHRQYFHQHPRRMQYPEFRETGYPIGSGTLESAVTPFNARLAGPGLRWTRATAHPLFVIRPAVLDHSFDDRWRPAP
jgi:hypothetical protein